MTAGRRGSAGRRAAGAPIRFGTSGWRGVVGEEFTLPRACAVVRAVARWLREGDGPARALVAHDTRPGGTRLVREAGAVLASEGVRVERVRGATPTPVVTRAVPGRGLGAGLVFTASHNPPAYHGLKVIGPRGSALGPEAVTRVEALANAILAAEAEDGAAVPGRRSGGAVRDVALVPEYLESLRARLDRDAFQRRRPYVHYDALHGAGAGVLDRALREAGARVEGRHLLPDARFGGVGPDPVPSRLRRFARRVGGARGLRLGLATDGDADRLTAVDANGRVLSSTQTLALLVDHLARSGRIERGVAISVATGSLVERVARAHGLPVTRHPIGFKWLSAALLAGEADCAGEESGGFVWSAHGVDKDGILAGVLLAEIVATTGAPLGERLAELVARHGPSHCARAELPASERCRERLARLRRSPPARVDGVRVEDVDRRDGLRLALPDGFLMLRGSGTEPVVRLYAEAPTPRRLRDRLAAGARWLAPGSSGNLAI
jgi:phosphomannomutase